MTSQAAVSAVHRFALGPRQSELQAAMRDPQAWLLGQLDAALPAAAFAGLPSSLDYLRREADYQQQQKVARQYGGGSDDPEAIKQMARALYREATAEELRRRYVWAATTPDGFAERIVRFWSNHFAVSVDKRPAALYAAPMEREAIRPHAFGSFTDLVLAVETHPAMLRYLDNTASVGDDSPQALRARAKNPDARGPGLNENLAREIMELHTLGVNGGYTQADVTELARAITGWGVPGARDFERDAAASSFMFRAGAHEGGTRSVLGRRYAQEGQAQGRAVLADLCVHPATARHVCMQLARHFVADVPPPTLVQRMAQAWTHSGGDLPAVYRVLVESREAWAADARKFRTPDDYLVAGLRAGGIDALDDKRGKMLVGVLGKLGQPPFTPRSPAGFADDAASWNGPDALWKRVQVAQSLARIGGDPDPQAVVDSVWGDRLDADTALAVHRAESRRDALALLFASPAFQWRA